VTNAVEEDLPYRQLKIVILPVISLYKLRLYKVANKSHWDRPTVDDKAL